MLQTDASQTATSGSAPLDARADVDALPAGSLGPETGNVITAAGTISAPAGADVVGSAPATVVMVRGEGGGAAELSPASAGTMQVAGRYGTLSMDAEGNYSYERSPGTPTGVQDVFTYTLANAAGGRDTATLTILIRREDETDPDQLTQTLATRDGVVVLPAGVELSDIRVVGRDLVITLPDGSTMVIPNGAVFVPQLVIGDVEVPPSNVAALLIDAEPQPAAGMPPSSGGNFADPVPPLDPGVPLGDLLPPVAMTFPEPVFEEAGGYVDREPEVLIQPDGQPASAAALDSVDEEGLPPRGSEPPGSNQASNSESTTGTILIDSPDDPSIVTINGVAVTSVGQEIAGEYGTLTITSISATAIGYSYTLDDNLDHSTQPTHEDFTVVVTDDDGDQDTATLRIDIVDDAPIARNDTDSIAAGQFGPATGNVITDAAPGDEGDSDTNAADTVGADDARVTAVSGVNSDGSFNDAGNLVVNGQYGVLTIAADGSYSYTRNEGTPGGVTDSFTYTLTDSDGSTDTATLTISIGDARPTLATPAPVQLDDDALPGGNPGGVGDDPDSVGASGTLVATGGDGDIDFAFSGTQDGLPEGFSANQVNASTLQILQGGTVVLTVTLNNETGAYTVVQNNPIDHPDGDNENNISNINVAIVATDVDGDTSNEVNLTINVDDDTPEITRADVGAPDLEVDETNLAVDASGDFSAIFDVSYGADGPGATRYAVSVVNGTDSGLVDVATGQSILLYNNDGVVEGRVGGEDGAVAFTVSVDSDSGVVTLDQQRALEHPNPSDPDDSVSPDATSIQLTVTATDADGDPVTQTVDIGANLAFDDDGPSISDAAAGARVVLDETTAGSPAGFPISATSIGAVITATTSFGADGAGTITYGLSLQGGGNSVASGLATAIGDHPITLVQVDGDTIEGRYNGTEVAFTIEMNADGTVTVTQLVPLEHLVDGSSAAAHNDPLDLGTLVNATVTVTDRDGDSVTEEAAIGDNIVFRDDGPSINVTASGEAGVVLTTQDAQTIGASEDSATSTADFSGVFAMTFDPGADGGAAPDLDYALGLTTPGGDSGLTQSGEPIYLYLIGGVVVGSTSATRAGVSAANTVFDVTVNGNGVVTLTQYSQIDHPAETPSDAPFADQLIGLADEMITLTASGTVTDNDGDTDTDSATINIGANLQFADDGPDISTALTGTQLRIDETDGETAPGEVDPVGGNLGTVTVAAATLFTVTHENVSADSPTTLSYDLTLSAQGVNSGLLLSTTDAPIYLYEIDGTVYGSTATSAAGVNSGNTAFTVSIDPATGAVTLTQFLAVEHYDTGSHDELSSAIAAGALSVTVTATDYDIDTDTATADLGSVIRFEDDGPSVDVTATGEGGVQLTTQDAQTIGAAEDSASSTADFSNVFDLTYDGGSDGAAATPDLSYTLGVSAQGANSGLTQTGAPIYLYLVGGTVVGSTSSTQAGVTTANTVFDVTVNANGVVTLTQYSQIDHTNTDPSATEAPFADHLISMADNLVTLTATSTVTDNDGDTDTDSATVNIGSNLRFADDGPDAVNDTDSVTSGGESTTGNVITGTGTTSGSAGADDVGADAPGTIVAVSSNNSGDTDSTFSGGVLTVVGQYGTLTIEADGDYTYTRNSSAPLNATEVFTYTLEDFDGDTDSATLTISISDRAPVLSTPPQVQLDDDALPGGNPGGTGDDPDAVNTTGTLSATGGDGDIDFYFSATQDGLPAGFTANQVDDSTLQILQDGTVVLTVTLNNETGEYSVVQNNPIDHPDGNQENNIGNINVSIYAEDADGDRSEADLTINVDDDTPVLSNVAAGAGVMLDETTAGSPAGFPISATSTSAVITATASYGADGPAATDSVEYGLTLTGGGDTLATDLETAQGNHAITLVQVDSDTIEGRYDGGNVAFTIEMNADGTVTYTQYVPLEHTLDGSTPAAHDDPLSLAGLVNATITITDADGDSATASTPIGANIVIEDDGPNAQVDGTATLDTLVLDESRPEGTDTTDGTAPAGDASTTASFADNFVATVDYGADGPGNVSYSFFLNGTDVASGLYALDGTDTTTTDSDGCGQGEEILLNQSGNTITGTAGGVTYFTITLNPATGVVTFTQLEPIWHPVDGTTSFDETAFLNTALASDVQVVQTVTDSDGDTDSASVNVGQGVFAIQDDGPTAFDPNPITSGLQNIAGESETAYLDVDENIDDNIGVDRPGTITFANIEEGQDSGFESGNQTIYYHLSSDGTVLVASTQATYDADNFDPTDAPEHVVFTVTLNHVEGPGDDTYTVTMYDTIDNGAGTVFDDLTSTSAGNVMYRGVGADDPATEIDLLLSAWGADNTSATVNTDNDSIGADNQSMNDDETVRIDFVTNLESGASNDTGFSYDDHVYSNSFLGTIAQVQGAQSAETSFTVYALDTNLTSGQEPDRDPDGPGDGFDDATISRITEVTVIGYAPDESEPVTLDLATVPDGDTVEVAYGIFVTENPDGSVTFSGVQEGDQYGFSTGDNDFNAIVVEAHGDFDLGVFSIGTVDSGDPINLSYDLTLSDADCDEVTVEDALQITIQPDPDFSATDAQQSLTLKSTAQSQDSELQLKSMNAANSNTVFLGAVAAAGLMASPLAAQTPSAELATLDGADTVELQGSASTAYSVDAKATGSADQVADVQDADDSAAASSSASGGAEASAEGNSVAGAQPAEQAAPTELQQAVDSPQQAASSDMSLVAQSVAMPSADALAAAAAANDAGAEAADVGQVVADALAGGGDGPDLDALIDAATSNGHAVRGPGDGPAGEGGAALEAVASLGDVSVPAWHSVGFAGFPNGHAFSMDVMMTHPDAPAPTAAG